MDKQASSVTDAQRIEPLDIYHQRETLRDTNRVRTLIPSDHGILNFRPHTVKPMYRSDLECIKPKQLPWDTDRRILKNSSGNVKKLKAVCLMMKRWFSPRRCTRYAGVGWFIRQDKSILRSRTKCQQTIAPATTARKHRSFPRATGMSHPVPDPVAVRAPSHPVGRPCVVMCRHLTRKFFYEDFRWLNESICAFFSEDILQDWMRIEDAVTNIFKVIMHVKLQLFTHWKHVRV